MDLMVVTSGLPLREVAIVGNHIVNMAVGAKRTQDNADESKDGSHAKSMRRGSHWRGMGW